jgi:hypothetical protein
VKEACTRCGGTGKQHKPNRLGYRTKELVTCKLCEGVGWREADSAFSERPPSPREWGAIGFMHPDRDH